MGRRRLRWRHPEPVTGVIAALIPVGAGIILEGVPVDVVLVGIVLAILAVILVSRVKDDRSGPSGLGLALLAGVTIGAFTICLAHEFSSCTNA